MFENIGYRGFAIEKSNFVIFIKPRFYEIFFAFVFSNRCAWASSSAT
jgi:hypothetical protein